jgi:hypothetical protein
MESSGNQGTTPVPGDPPRAPTMGDAQAHDTTSRATASSAGVGPAGGTRSRTRAGSEGAITPGRVATIPLPLRGDGNIRSSAPRSPAPQSSVPRSAATSPTSSTASEDDKIVAAAEAILARRAAANELMREFVTRVRASRAARPSAPSEPAPLVPAPAVAPAPPLVAVSPPGTLQAAAPFIQRVANVAVAELVYKGRPGVQSDAAKWAHGNVHQLTRERFHTDAARDELLQGAIRPADLQCMILRMPYVRAAVIKATGSDAPWGASMAQYVVPGSVVSAVMAAIIHFDATDLDTIIPRFTKLLGGRMNLQPKASIPYLKHGDNPNELTFAGATGVPGQVTKFFDPVVHATEGWQQALMEDEESQATCNLGAHLVAHLPCWMAARRFLVEGKTTEQLMKLPLRTVLHAVLEYARGYYPDGKPIPVEIIAEDMRWREDRERLRRGGVPKDVASKGSVLFVLRAGAHGG